MKYQPGLESLQSSLFVHECDGADVGADGYTESEVKYESLQTVFDNMEPINLSVGIGITRIDM